MLVALTNWNLHQFLLHELSLHLSPSQYLLHDWRLVEDICVLVELVDHPIIFSKDVLYLFDVPDIFVLLFLGCCFSGLIHGFLDQVFVVHELSISIFDRF